MSKARQIVVVMFGLGVALCFLRIPWTEDVGYSWLWSRPKPVAVTDIVEDARQSWRTEYEANTSDAIASDLAKRFEDNPGHPYKPMTKEEKPDFELRARVRLENARIRRDSLTKKLAMSDEEVISWLKDPRNFSETLPSKAGLGDQEKLALLDDWEKNVRPIKERNRNVATTRIDFTRIGMELAVLLALLLVGFVLSIKRAV